MTTLWKLSFLILAVLLPLTTQAKPTGEIVYKHPVIDNNELWITDITDIKNGRMFFQHTTAISNLDIEVDGHYIIFTARRPETSIIDIYLIDGRKPKEKARNLTQGRFALIGDIDISKNGDIVFTNRRPSRPPNPPKGIHLIKNDELNAAKPNFMTLIDEIYVSSLVWSPNREQIAYHTDDDIFTLDIATQETILILREARYPAYSPDGNKLAFINRSLFDPQDIRIISLNTFEVEKIIKLNDRQGLNTLKWTPDGNYLIYRTDNNVYSVSIEEGISRILFNEFDTYKPVFDWVDDLLFSVEPNNHLTTLWGKLKQ